MNQAHPFEQCDGGDDLKPHDRGRGASGAVQPIRDGRGRGHRVGPVVGLLNGFLVGSDPATGQQQDY